jgi:aspartate/methionine/tyrosine aminotransferase
MTIDLARGYLCLDRSDPERSPDPCAEYGPPEGYPPLREVIADWMDVSAANVILTTGASLGLAATLATLERPCSIFCPRPYYPLYPRLASLLGITPIFYDLEARGGWQPDPDLLWNLPGNPVGSLPTKALLERSAEVVERLDLMVVADEVYADFVYDGGVMPDLARALGEKRVVRVRSFSKLLSMPGERLGFVVAPCDRLAAICHAHWTLALSAPASAQAAALLSLRQGIHGWLGERRAVLRTNRDRMVDTLARCDGLAVHRPSAGIFLWIGAERSPLDSVSLAKACAEKAGVVVSPGLAFGVVEPPFIRVCFAVPPEEAVRGAHALAEFFSSIEGPATSG